MRACLFFFLIVGVAALGADNHGQYAAVVRKIQPQLPPGWIAELKQFKETPTIVIASPRMQVISNDPSRPPGNNSEDGQYSLHLSILPRLAPEAFDAMKARNDSLRAQLQPLSKRKVSDHNKRLFAQIVWEPDVYDGQSSYSLYSPFRPAERSDIEACKQMFQRVIPLFRIYPQSEYSDPTYYESRLHPHY